MVMGGDIRYYTRGEKKLLTVNQMLHPLLAVVRREQHAAAHADGGRAERHSFQDVGAATNPAIHVDFHLVEDLRAAFVEFQERDDGRRAGVQVASAVVTEQDAVQPGLHSQHGVVCGHDAFQTHREMRVFPHPRQVLPCEARVDESGHDAAQAAALFVVRRCGWRHWHREAFVGFHPLVGLALAGPCGVDCHEDRFDVGVRGALAEERGGLLAVSVDVELEEEAC